jgi:hypothetical protein
MPGLFVVKVKSKENKVTQEQIPVTKFMKMEMPYAVLDVFKHRDRDGLFYTWFLIGDQDSGELQWVESHAVLFVGVV